MRLFLENLDSGKSTCIIFFHLSNVFDTVDYEILLRELTYYGIRGM